MPVPIVFKNIALRLGISESDAILRIRDVCNRDRPFYKKLEAERQMWADWRTREAEARAERALKDGRKKENKECLHSVHGEAEREPNGRFKKVSPPSPEVQTDKAPQGDS